LRILWYNWRDIKNPEAGGAEVFTHEIASRLVNKNHEVHLFTSAFANSPDVEKIDGVRVIRDGSKYSVYKKAEKYYKSKKEDYDIVIDEINTRPFLAPKFVKDVPILAIFHQLAREFWFYETRFPINLLGYYYLENKWLSKYRNVPTVTISNSSRKDLEERGFQKILMVPEGLKVTPLSELKKKGSIPKIVFMGRLKKAKLPHHALEAFSIIKKEFNDAEMSFIGDGYMRKKLQKSKTRDVTFYGRIDEELKYRLLSHAHIILVPGVREGWGLIVTEANAMGTPAVGYNVPGLRDSIIDGKTGVLVKVNSPGEIARSAISLLREPEKLYELSANALAFARQFNWDTTAIEFEKIIEDLGNNNSSNIYL